MREKQLASVTFLPPPHDEMCLPHEACLLAQGAEMYLLCGRERVFASAAQVPALLRCALHAEGLLQVIIVEECYSLGMLLIARAGEARLLNKRRSPCCSAGRGVS